MPLIIKPSTIKYKNPSTGEYENINSVAEKSSQEMIADINAAGQIKINAINTAGNTHLSTINARATEINAQYPKSGEIKDMLADTFNQNSNYGNGKYVVQPNGSDVDNLYKLPDGHTSGTTFDNTTKIGPLNLADEVTDLKSAFEPVEEYVFGTKNYTENKKLITTAGVTKGTPTDDNRFSISDFIPISLITSGSSIKVNYGSIPENTLFGVYNSAKEFLDSWALQSSDTSRTFTFSYTGYTDPTYCRFAFKKGQSASVKDALETVTYWKTEIENSLDDKFSEIERDIDTVDENAMQKKDFLDYSMVNKLNPSTVAIGKFIAANGTLSDHSDYFVTDYIPINESETLYCYTSKTLSGVQMRTFCAYDKDKNVLSALGSNNAVYSITQTGQMAFIRATCFYSPANNITQYTTGILENTNPEYLPGYENPPVFVSDYIRKKIYIKATDTETQVIQKLVNAYSVGNCDVIFDRASYSFGTALATVGTDYSLPSNEIPIGNNCHYFFNGATLTATIDLSEHSAVGDDEFYCNFFGCQRTPSSYEMHDGVLEATDTRYIVHDESSALVGSYKHLYQNIEMHYHTSVRQEDIRKCIGGGTGASGVVEIVGCKFTTDGTDACVSFHGNGTDVAGAEFDMNIRDSWFSNYVRAGVLSANQTAKLFYTGNSALSAPSTYERWTVTSFLNEIRS